MSFFLSDVGFEGMRISGILGFRGTSEALQLVAKSFRSVTQGLGFRFYLQVPFKL